MISLLLVVLVPSTLGGRACFKGPLKWTASGKEMLLNGKYAYNVEGMNWWGAQGVSPVPLGLKSHDIAWHLDIFSNSSLNSMRYPVSAQMAYENIETKYQGKLALDVMEEIIDDAAKRGITVMIDMHRIARDDERVGLWYTPEYPEEYVLGAWDILLDRFKGKWNVFALDLFNEPHGPATWGTGNVTTDWRLAAERIIKHIGTKHPEFTGLFFVQGVCCGLKKWFNRDMENFPVSTGDQSLDDRIVYSGHHYRPGRKQPDEPAPTREDLFPDLDRAFGQVESQTGKPLVFGEWGFNLEAPKDVVWVNLFKEWLKNQCISNMYYWGLQGGEPGRAVVDKTDETTVDYPKLDLIATMLRKPSRLTYSKRKGQYCISTGRAVC